MKTRTLLYGALMLLLAIGVGSAWVAQFQLNHQNEASLEAANGDSNGSDVVSEHVTLTVTEGTAKKWQLVVDKAVYSKEGGEAKLVGVSGELYGATGDAVAKFSSPRGLYDEATKTMTLLGGGTMRSVEDNGALIKAPTLTWSTRSNRVAATGGVVATVADGLTSKGSAADFALDMSDVVFTGGVSTQLGAS